MLHIEQAIIVEGKYDKIHLSQIVDAVIIVTNGFGIYKDKDIQALVRHYAKTTGIIIMTDSDSAGNMIRGRIKSIAGDDAKIYNAYVPEIFGKEKRKNAPSKEGKLGVEGIEPALICEALERCGVRFCGERSGERVTMQRFIEDGVSGGKNSRKMREEMCRALKVPCVSSKALLDIVNSLMSAEEYRELITSLKCTCKTDGSVL